jgi:2-polyprenyl-3-methyl-5-hydroxy-6-metoxy-1,4-benzoquinol methylase
VRTETLGACPLCRATSRRMLYDRLEDETHHAVQGTFALWECSDCRGAYLDPRPMAGDIVRAYAGYQTHGAPEDAFALPPSRLGRFRRAARNGYVNARYGYHAAPASQLGGALVAALPPLRFAIDHWAHRLPARAGGKLLDVGCGNGGWLLQMRTLGWQTYGVDFDPAAVRIARSAGLNVELGGIDAAREERYDAISLNHVIEHLFDPIAALTACARLLAPGGRIWIATPNLDALGHRLYRAHWRGIEAPRHLMLFRAQTLERALHAAGLIADGPLRTRPWAKEHYPARHRLRARVADIAGLLAPSMQEELVYVARS